MRFRLTYEGPLTAHRDDKTLLERSLRVHEMRKQFHLQMKALRKKHPVLTGIEKLRAHHGEKFPFLVRPIIRNDGFNWLPLVTEANGLICKLDILMLREGQPGHVLYDIDNRLKTLFDALRRAKSSNELGRATKLGQQTPAAEEDPFYVLLEDDNLITHVGITTDVLLQPVPQVPPDIAVRLIIDVTVPPYDTLKFSNSHFV
jgi:hypothetical protein